MTNIELLASLAAYAAQNDFDIEHNTDAEDFKFSSDWESFVRACVPGLTGAEWTRFKVHYIQERAGLSAQKYSIGYPEHYC